MTAAVWNPVIQQFLHIDGLAIDLDKTMTYIRNKGVDDGTPRYVVETMLCILNEIMIGAVFDEEEHIPLWDENSMVSLGWFLRVHGQTSGNSFFEPVDIMSDEEEIDSRSDSPTGVASIWPSDEDEDLDGGITDEDMQAAFDEDLDGGITDEDMRAAFYVLEMMHADIGEFEVEVEDL